MPSIERYRVQGGLGRHPGLVMATVYVAGALVLLGCAGTSDPAAPQVSVEAVAAPYELGESIEFDVRNGSDRPIVLDACPAGDLERRGSDGSWSVVVRDPTVACTLEMPPPVAPGEARRMGHFPVRRLEPGRYRFVLGFRWDEEGPRRVVVSPEFSVLAPDAIAN